MKRSLKALHVLDAIDRKGSFARAADDLHRVPAAILTRKHSKMAWGSAFRSHGPAVLGRGGNADEAAPPAAAAELECRVQQGAKLGIEMRIAIDTISPPQDFGCSTSLRAADGTGCACTMKSWEAHGCARSGRADMATAAQRCAFGAQLCAPLSAIGDGLVAAPVPSNLPEPAPLTQRSASDTARWHDETRGCCRAPVGLFSGQDAHGSMLAAKTRASGGLGVGFLPRGWR